MTRHTTEEHSSWPRIVYSFLAVVLVSGALYSGYLFFTTVRALAARTSLPFVESVDTPHVTPSYPSQERLPDIVRRKERVNILLLGIDQRGNGKSPWRTDTMILASVDLATKSASILSIPRDLWVMIPGFEPSRINTAHSTGDGCDYPGGGVALAKKTVSQALGVPVHYYVRINFTGFEQLIDLVGGIEIEVEEAIHDEAYPDGHYGTMVVDIPAGLQQMDGKTLLQYARSRHGNTDYDRMKRQQKILMAARAKALSLDVPLSQVPRILGVLGDSLRTDLSVEDIIALASALRDIDVSRIKRGVIDDSMTVTTVTPKGWMVEVADWDQVRSLVDGLFPPALPSVEPMPSLVQAQLASEEGKIEVQNGTPVAALAREATQALRENGFNVVQLACADNADYHETILIDYAGKSFTVKALAEHLDVREGNVLKGENGPEGIDILVILGQDYVEKNGG